MAKEKSFGEIMTGKKGRFGRITDCIPEDEFRYLYALLTEHDGLSMAGRDMLLRLITSMGKTIDKWNKGS